MTRLLPATNFIGFDRAVNYALGNAPNKFPPYDLVKIGEDQYTLTLAVAGYKKEDISITVDNSILNLSGEWKNTKDTPDYIYSGIAKRNFNLQFRLSEFVEVENADLVDGILTVKLFKRIPEDKKVKSILIN